MDIATLVRLVHSQPPGPEKERAAVKLVASTGHLVEWVSNRLLSRYRLPASYLPDVRSVVTFALLTRMGGWEPERGSISVFLLMRAAPLVRLMSEHKHILSGTVSDTRRLIRFSKARALLEVDLGREPTDEEVVEMINSRAEARGGKSGLKVTVENVRRAKEVLLTNPASLSAQLGPDDERTALDLVAEDAWDRMFRLVELGSVVVDAIRQVSSSLSARHAEVMVVKLRLDAGLEHAGVLRSNVDTAEILGLTSREVARMWAEVTAFLAERTSLRENLV